MNVNQVYIAAQTNFSKLHGEQCIIFHTLVDYSSVKWLQFFYEIDFLNFNLFCVASSIYLLCNEYTQHALYCCGVPGHELEAV